VLIAFSVCCHGRRPHEHPKGLASVHAEIAFLAERAPSMVRKFVSAAACAIDEGSPSYARMLLPPLQLLVLLLLLPVTYPALRRPPSCLRCQELLTSLA